MMTLTLQAPDKPVVICRKCHAPALITRTQQKLRRDGRLRTHTAVQCESCGHEFWSRRHDVLAWSRYLDRKAKMG